MKLIINADDFGFSKSINDGIIDAYREGLISSTTIMVNMPCAEDAISKWKENRSLTLGLHINLTQGSPVSGNANSLVDESGVFYKHQRIENSEVEVLHEDVCREIEAQINKLLSYGVKIDHLDYHHDIQLNPIVREAMMNLALTHKLVAFADRGC